MTEQLTLFGSRHRRIAKAWAVAMAAVVAMASLPVRALVVLVALAEQVLATSARSAVALVVWGIPPAAATGDLIWVRSYTMQEEQLGHLLGTDM